MFKLVFWSVFFLGLYFLIAGFCSTASSLGFGVTWNESKFDKTLNVDSKKGR